MWTTYIRSKGHTEKGLEMQQVNLKSAKVQYHMILTSTHYFLASYRPIDLVVYISLYLQIQILYFFLASSVQYALHTHTQTIVWLYDSSCKPSQFQTALELFRTLSNCSKRSEFQWEEFKGGKITVSINRVLCCLDIVISFHFIFFLQIVFHPIGLNEDQ